MIPRNYEFAEQSLIILIITPARLLTLLSFILFTPHVNAQNLLQDFDSLSVNKPKRSNFSYEFEDPELKTISIKEDNYVQSPKRLVEGLSNFGRDIFMEFAPAFFGVSSSSKEVICNPRGKLICNDHQLSWEVHLFCPGVMQTEREKEDDGVSIRSYTTMHWQDAAFGIILEKNDTIATFEISSDPRNNTKFDRWNAETFLQQPSRYPPPKQRKIMDYREGDIEEFYIDFGLFGEFRNEKFVLIFNGDLGISSFYRQEKLMMTFYNDIDDFFTTYKLDLFGKKYPRLQSYIKLISSDDLTDKKDMIRMAMASRYLTKILSRGKY